MPKLDAFFFRDNAGGVSNWPSGYMEKKPTGICWRIELPKTGANFLRKQVRK